MTKLLTTAFALVLFAAWPVVAQESGAAGGLGEGQAERQGAGAEAGGVTPSGLQDENEAAPAVQQENAARTETPSVRGAETTPEAGVQQAGAEPGPAGEAAVADPTLPDDVTQRAGIETERETTAGYDDAQAAGAAMPQTASALPMLMGLGAALALAGIALRLSAGSR